MAKKPIKNVDGGLDPIVESESGDGALLQTDESQPIPDEIPEPSATIKEIVTPNSDEVAKNVKTLTVKELVYVKTELGTVVENSMIVPAHGMILVDTGLEVKSKEPKVLNVKSSQDFTQRTGLILFPDLIVATMEEKTIHVSMYNTTLAPVVLEPNEIFAYLITD